MSESANLNRFRSGSDSHHEILYRARHSALSPQHVAEFQSRAVADIEALVEDYQDVVDELTADYDEDIKQKNSEYEKLEKENAELENKVEALEKNLDLAHEQMTNILTDQEEIPNFLWAFYAIQMLDQLFSWVKAEQALQWRLMQIKRDEAERAEIKRLNAQSRKETRKVIARLHSK